MEEVPINVRKKKCGYITRRCSHNSCMVRDFLHLQLPEKWMGTNGPLLWPARSPDLTPHDFYFFFVGCLKDIVYATQPVSLVTY